MIIKAFPKNKPRQWGPNEAVRNAGRDYYEKIGVVPPLVLSPCWETSDNASIHNYGSQLINFSLVGPIRSNENVYFDGSNDYAKADVSGKTLAGVTVIMRWKTTAAVSGDKGLFQWADALSDGSPWLFCTHNTQYATRTIDVYCNGGYRWNNLTWSNEGVWFTIAVTGDGTTWRLYKDGVQDPTPYTGGLTTGQSAAASFYLGNAFGGYASGLLDYVKVFPSALSSNIIAADFSQPYADVQPRSVPVYFFPSAGGGETAEGQTSIQAVGELITSGDKHSSDETSISAVGQISATASKAGESGTDISAIGLTVAETLKISECDTDISGTGGVTGSGDKIGLSSTSITSTGSILSDSLKLSVNDTNSSGIASVSATAEKLSVGQVNVESVSACSGTGAKIAVAESAISGIGVVESTGVKIEEDSFAEGSTTIVAAGAIASSGISIRIGSTSVQCVGALSSTGSKVDGGTTEILASGAIDTNGTAILGGSTSILCIVGDIASNGLKVVEALTGASAISVMDTFGLKIAVSTTDVTAVGSVESDGEQSSSGSGHTVISATASVSSSGTPIRAGPTAVTATGQALAVAETIRIAQSSVSGVGHIVSVGTSAVWGTALQIVNLTGNIDRVVDIAGNIDRIIAIIGGIAVTAKNQNFEMYQGDSKIIRITVPENLDAETTTARWQAALTVKASPVISKSSDADGGITLSNDSGVLVISIALSPDDTELIPGQYHHEAEIIDGEGNVSTVTVGVMTIKRAAIVPPTE